MPPDPPSTPPGHPFTPWHGFTDSEMLRFLEAFLARPLNDPEAHATFCARLAAELLRRALLQEPAEGESKAVH